MPLYVPAEPIPREAPRHNLVDSAEDITFGPNPIEGEPSYESQWAHGVSLRDVWNAELSSWSIDCAFWPGDVKPDLDPAVGPLTWDTFTPFEVYTQLTCLVSGSSTDMDELARIAARQIEVGLSKAIEAELWTGAQGSATGTPNLQTDPTIIGGGTAVDYPFGLAVAGQALANCGLGARGFIHAPPIVVGMWLDGNQLEEDDRGRLITRVRGDVVVAGSGYPGTGEDGAAVANNESWIFATSPVGVKIDAEPTLTPEGVAEAVDRATNTVTFRASTLALYAFDTSCHFAIKVDY